MLTKNRDFWGNYMFDNLTNKPKPIKLYWSVYDWYELRSKGYGSMKIISVHDWKIFVQIVCKSVDFMSKPFKKQDEIQDSQLQIILNKGRPRLTYY